MMYHWIKIAASAAAIPFNAQGLAAVEAEGKRLCVGRHGGKMFAFAPGCPHAGGLLAAGWIDALGNVVCPLHRYRFCMSSGRNVSGEGYHLVHWPLEERADGIWVGLKPGHLPGFPDPE